MNTQQLSESKHKLKIQEWVQNAEALRRDPDEPSDVTLADVMDQEDEPISMTELYQDLGINPSVDTLENIFTVPDTSVRWLVPEIIRDALRLGLRRAPIYPNIIAAEQTLKGLNATIPHWNMSDAKPRHVGEAETISLGSLSIGQKSVSLKKMGRGIKISYEVKQYCAINIVSIFLQDFGVKLGQGLDNQLIDVLINGEQTNGSESAAVVGIATPGSLTYRDLLTIWVRMGRLSRSPKAIIGGEAAAINTLDLPEFKNRYQGSAEHNLNVKTPIPTQTDYYVHGAVPANQQIIIDPNASIIKYNAQPLLVETEKIVSNQTEATYATLTTGFAVMMRDGRVIVDDTLNVTGNTFPDWMDPKDQEVVVID